MTPAKIVFADVETTGLGHEDRVVSIGAIRVTVDAVRAGTPDIEWMHLVFDPGRNSHPRAEQVHGYSDWSLRCQDPFKDHADQVWNFLHGAPVIAGHNIGFDAKFIDRELSASGCSRIGRPLFCTMQEYRGRGIGGSASLGTACERIGIRRLGERHGALEDAWLAMALYFWLHDCPVEPVMPLELRSGPTNMRMAPPRSANSMPHRIPGKVAPLP
ncbi:3'-5' exonuclease [Microvirga sp. 2TAF3]|uniref:3'-5' exonuclease n=1 Tax=Microvirga sp. 2TAF3 TaxID=3233014 RepID=UPI003F9B9D4C